MFFSWPTLMQSCRNGCRARSGCGGGSVSKLKLFAPTAALHNPGQPIGTHIAIRIGTHRDNTLDILLMQTRYISSEDGEDYDDEEGEDEDAEAEGEDAKDDDANGQDSKTLLNFTRRF
jgi:hypothetical protein